jgi:hypothetical protein
LGAAGRHEEHDHLVVRLLTLFLEDVPHRLARATVAILNTVARRTDEYIGVSQSKL